MSGGRTFPAVVTENFTVSKKRNDKTNRYELKCNHCSVRATVEGLSRDLAGDPKHIYKHKYDRKAHLAGDPKRKG